MKSKHIKVILAVLNGILVGLSSIIRKGK